MTGVLPGPVPARHLWFLLFSVAAAAGIFAYLFSAVSLAEVISLLRGITARWLALFVVLSFAGSMFRTWRYRVLLAVSGYHPRVAPLFLVTLVRNFFADLLPARLGTLVYIYLVQTRLNIPFGAAASSFAHDFLFDLISLSFLVAAAVLVQSAGLVSPLALTGAAIFLAGGSIAVLLLLPGILDRGARLALALPRTFGRLGQGVHAGLADTAAQVVATRQGGVFWRIFALAMGVRCCKYLSLYVLLLGLVAPLGYDQPSFPLARVFLGLCSAELAASLPISGIAGFGVYEGAWTLVFQLLGYPERIAALTSISHHLLTQVYGYSLGGLALLVLLLPVFAGKDPQGAGGRAAAGRFWGAYAGAVAVLTLLVLLLYPAAGTTGRVQEPGGSMAAFARQEEVPLVKVAGSLVYQRPDGIYTLDLQQKKPRRIAAAGTYPRWSPDGASVAFVRGNAIMVARSDGAGPREVATAQKARAVCFAAAGRALLFSDGGRLRRVDLATGTVSDLLTDGEILEVDQAGQDARKIAFTVKTLFGYRVKVLDLATGRVRAVAAGCSAGLAPDGSLVTVNGPRHDELHLYDWVSLRLVAMVKAPPGMKFDNQHWSNHPRLLVATAEGQDRDIFLQDAQGGEALRVTASGDCDRADLHVSGVLP